MNIEKTYYNSVEVDRFFEGGRFSAMIDAVCGAMDKIDWFEYGVYFEGHMNIDVEIGVGESGREVVLVSLEIKPKRKVDLEGDKKTPWSFIWNIIRKFTDTGVRDGVNS